MLFALFWVIGVFAMICIIMAPTRGLGLDSSIWMSSIISVWSAGSLFQLSGLSASGFCLVLCFYSLIWIIVPIIECCFSLLIPLRSHPSRPYLVQFHYTVLQETLHQVAF